MSKNHVIHLFGKNQFGPQHSDYLGGKGAALAELLNMGLPVPPLVNLNTAKFHEWNNARLESDSPEAADALILAYASQASSSFSNNKLAIGTNTLVSVRSGAPVSMPGMMDTILNVGLSLEHQEFWEEKFGARWFWDSYSRLLLQLADALGLTNLPLHDASKGFKIAQTVTGLLFKVDVDVDVLTSPIGALQVAIDAVFQSWNTERAVYYRNMNDIPHDMGTACNIQKMVFGNIDDQSGTGVLFTRNPSNGENQVTGEFLVQAQGEDVVDGSTTPMSLKDFKKSTLPPAIGEELFKLSETLEQHFGDMQDVEFTIEQGKLWVLQTRTAKRTSEAAFRIAVEMIEDGELLIQNVLDGGRLTNTDWVSAKGRSIKSAPKPDYTGLASGSGIAQGRAVFTSQEAVDATDPVILVRPETTPDDIAGMYSAKGIVTFEGGMTSHAAVVARGMNKPCVVGVSKLAGCISEGDIVTLDSANGLVWVNADVEIDDRGGSVYADRYMLMVQDHWGEMVRRNRYVKNSVLALSQMSEIEFGSMLEQVTESGDWLENVYLVTEPIPSYCSDGSTLEALAELALQSTLVPMTNARCAKVHALKPKALYYAEADAVQSISELEMSEGWVRLDKEKFDGFLGTKAKEIMDFVLGMECAQSVLDWAQDEEEFAKKVFK